MVRLLPVFAGALGLWAAARLARAGWGVPSALGAGTAQMRAVANRSPHAVDGRFANTEPSAVATAVEPPGDPRTRADPRSRGPSVRGRPARAGRAGWTHRRTRGDLVRPLGVLLEIDGRRVLADPMWSERASPSRRIGPRRLHPTPTGLDRLPAVDAVLISHDHYDHLDKATS